MNPSPRPAEAVATVATDAGVLALWDPRRFAGTSVINRAAPEQDDFRVSVETFDRPGD